MKKYQREIGLGILLLTLFGGLIFWFVKYEPDAVLKIVIAGISVLVGAFAFIRQVLKSKSDKESGAPPEDEFTKLARVYAGSRAFLYSMYLWFLIFIFHTSFSNQEEMLGIGIMGSALIYGLFLWYYKSKGGFSEE